MFGLLARLFRVLWRQESEGFEAGATLLPFPAPTSGIAVTAAPVEFIRRSADAVPQPRSHSPRQLAARLQSVQRLNAPSGRSRPRAVTPPSGRPTPLSGAPERKATQQAKPGVVLDRIASRRRRPSAEIVNLTDVRRARQIAASDREIAALFN
jgi:hypothetical protein